MPTEIRNDPRRNFAPRFLPWLLAAGALAVYLFTLNRWVSLLNLGGVAKISGWTWQPELASPVLFVITLPFRWLSPALIPLALNLFSAVCAALTLGLLARSVAILPHDRTEDQRKRETSDFSFLTTRTAWLPPLLAAAVCGLQLTFWQHATNFTGEMLDLLLFAFVVWSLLEYRLDEREGRLFLAALVFGAGMADDWAMVGFLPVFLMALIWSRGLNFFNIRFLTRLFLCGLAGSLFYLLLPLLTVSSGKFPMSFWQALAPNLTVQWHVVEAFFTSADVRHNVGLMSLTTLVPLFVLAIRWSANFGDSSRVGAAFTGFMFHVVHALVLGVCIWVTFDPPFSPRHFGYGSPCLTFYYLGALGVGYFSGYFLIVFGPVVAGKSSRRGSPLDFLNPVVVVGVFALATLAVVGLIYKNAPQVRKLNDNTLSQYASLVEENLPRNGAIVLSDSDDPNQDQPLLLFTVQAALARDGRAKDFLLVDTKALAWPVYHRFLHQNFPQRWPQIVSDQESRELNPHGLFNILNILSKTNELYYLHPSYGYYFEQFYQEPHGLIYKLKPLPEDTLVPPPPGTNLIAANEAFWSRLETEVFPRIEKELAPLDPNAPKSRGERLLKRLHITRDADPTALLAGNYYSRDLNFWGVELQRAGELEKAAARFETAKKLNPDNVVAQINLEFNQSLRAGKNASVDLGSVTSDRFGKWHDWMEVTDANGPFDEPSFCFQGGFNNMQSTYLRQAIASFARVRELVPDYLPARFLLAQLYIINQLPDRALDALREPLADPGKFSIGETNSTQLNVLAAAAYFLKNDNAESVRLLQTEISRHPMDVELMSVVTKAYMVHGLFTNALDVIDRELQLTPGDPNWLFGKGIASLRIKAYGDAIAAFTGVLAVQTNNNEARFNRAIASLDSDQLDAARADYLQLQQTYTNSFQIAYGLGDIAWRKHDHSEAIRNYEIYLANANTNTAEARDIIERLKSLKR